MLVRIQPSRKGIALIVVMLVIVVLSLLAAGFSYSMKVETRLAQNAAAEAELYWVAQSGVAYASYLLAMESAAPRLRQYRALNQKWAGGLGDTNELTADLALTNSLASATFALEISDLERKVNINLASREMLERAMELLGYNTLESATVIDSIEDWKDTDDSPRVNGAESDFYLTRQPPHISKDGYLDDLSELLLVNGVTPEMYWGAERSQELRRFQRSRTAQDDRSLPGLESLAAARFGLVDLFSTAGPRAVNVNTASREVLQLLPGVDANLADSIVRFRAGLDGVDGTEDDTPFETPGELGTVGGMTPQFVQALSSTCTTMSTTFEVRVHVSQGTYRRTFWALVYCMGRDARVLNTHWL